VERATRLTINQPPRSGKSICASVAYPAWLLGHDPTLRIIVVSHSNDLAGDLHGQFRRVLESDWYQRLFPDTILSKDTALEAVTTVGGGRYATSTEGSLTGRGADLIIIDDPHKAEEAHSEKALAQVWEWYSEQVSRLNDQRTGKIILVMQRLHMDDLAGRLLAKQGWTHLNLPALAPYDQSIPLGNGAVKHWLCDEPLEAQRCGREELERIKREIGSVKFNTQYLQQPKPKAGNFIQLHWFKRYDKAPVKQAGDRIVQSWDIASGLDEHHDFSVCTTWLVTKEKKYYLLDVFRARLVYPDLRRRIRSNAFRFAADVILIEKSGIGESLLGEFANNPPGGMVRPIAILPKGNKADRLAAQSAKIEAGHVYLPADAPWLADFVAEVLAFPHARHDDQVDSVSQFLYWVSSWRRDLPLTISLPVYGD
jgi:predicted phage terminase large subunit-like protein